LKKWNIGKYWYDIIGADLSEQGYGTNLSLHGGLFRPGNQKKFKLKVQISRIKYWPFITYDKM